MSFHSVLLFSITVFVASMIPGPTMLLALTHGMRHGVKRTVASALGNVTVTLIQALVSIVGLGTILIASETVFLAVKWAGAVYLVYMGISILRSSDMPLSPGNSTQTAKPASLRKLYTQAALVTAGNPKAIVFFTAVFPQFFDSSAAPFIQFCVLLTVLSFIAFTCFMIYAIGGRKIVTLFSKAAVGKYVKRVIGGTFIGAGIGLAASNK